MHKKVQNVSYVYSQQKKLESRRVIVIIEKKHGERESEPHYDILVASCSITHTRSEKGGNGRFRAMSKS